MNVRIFDGDRNKWLHMAFNPLSNIPHFFSQLHFRLFVVIKTLL
ncbi:MAG: hypothetical protein WBZ33_05870 [Thermoactinomyces sp.]|jgi:hypothetical protein